MIDCPFVSAVAKPPPNRLQFLTKAQTTNWLSAPHFFLDKLSERSPEDSGEYWDKVSRYGCNFYTILFQYVKNREILEKLLHFGGKGHSCRSPPNFR